MSTSGTPLTKSTRSNRTSTWAWRNVTGCASTKLFDSGRSKSIMRISTCSPSGPNGRERIPSSHARNSSFACTSPPPADTDDGLQLVEHLVDAIRMSRDVGVQTAQAPSRASPTTSTSSSLRSSSTPLMNFHGTRPCSPRASRSRRKFSTLFCSSPPPPPPPPP